MLQDSVPVMLERDVHQPTGREVGTAVLILEQIFHRKKNTLNAVWLNSG